MSYGLKPASANLATLLSSRNAVVMWDTYVFTFADGVQVTLTSKDRDWIPALPSPPPPAPGTVLLDTFTGPAGNLIAHTPDLAPTGFAWAQGGSSGDMPRLDGAGGVYSATGAAVDAKADVFDAVTITTPFTVRADVTLTGFDASSDTFVDLNIFNDVGQTDGVEVNIGAAAGGAPVLNVFTSLGDSFQQSAANGAHSYVFIFNAANVSISVDGGAPSVVSANVPTSFSFGYLDFVLAIAGTANHSCQRFQLTQD